MKQGVKQFLLFSGIPESAVRHEIDGNVYGLIPHKFDGQAVVENYESPRMVRIETPSFKSGGVVYIWFATLGEAVFKQTLIPNNIYVIEK